MPGAAVTIWTYDWVPEQPRGFVRDLRLRWACEEADIPYSIRTVPFEGRETNHLDRQPFGQVPMLDDGNIELFESGACLIHLAQKSESLMPRDPAGQAHVLQWIVAGLNSIEMVTMPWIVQHWSGDDRPAITQWLDNRLDQVEAVLSSRDWLVADRFTAADLLMADVLRLPAIRDQSPRPATDDYVARVTDRPAFRKAQADQLDHFAAADSRRQTESRS